MEPMTDELGELPTYTGKPLIYGVWRESWMLGVVARDWALAAATELDAILGAETWAEAFAASNAATHVYGPVDDECLEVHDPNAPVDVQEIPGVGDGDWPPMIPLHTAEFLPEEWPIGAAYETIFNGEGVVVDLADEARLLEIARLAGADLVRDDDLIARLDPLWAL